MMENRGALPLLPLLGLSVYFVTGAFYVFPSGTPQPADYFLVFIIGLTILFSWRSLPADRHLYFGAALLIAWIIVVNAFWFMATSETQFLEKTTYYLFNILAFLFVVACGNHDFRRLRLVIRWSCIAALFLQLAYLQMAEPVAGSRAIGTFNNPNQLGYWALLVMACLAVVKDRAHLDSWDVLALSFAAYFIVLSSSRAASVSAAVLIALIIFSRGFSRTSGAVAAGLLVLGITIEATTGALVANLTESQPVSGLVNRFEHHEEDPILGRGYLRIVEHPEYLLFGAGEGDFARFGDERGAREFHSSFGNLLLSYGVIGLGLFGFLLYGVMRAAPWPSVAFVVPVMLYGITHMGLRFTLFWVFLAIVYAQARHRSRSRLARRSPRPGRRHRSWRWRRRRAVRGRVGVAARTSTPATAEPDLQAPEAGARTIIPR